MAHDGTLKIALLTYRGHPHVGGQGVYVHYLSRALAELGHHVTVFAGPPYPALSDQVSLVRVPSLDLYRPDDPFRRPSRHEFKDVIDYLEYGLMCTAAFPEPLTFSLRVARLLSIYEPAFDIVHDNQCLGYGLLTLQRRGRPVVATIHHPISVDRRLDLDRAGSRQRRVSLRRWYSFTRMQARVARRLPRLIAVSESARDDVAREFRVDPTALAVVYNGVDPELFRPLPDAPRRPGRVITIASSALPMKGLAFLVEAIAKLRTEREAELIVVGRGGDDAATRALVTRFGLDSAVRFEGRVDALRLVELYASAEVAVVPSLYEGFSLPAAEAMSCGVPLVATTAGALPEVAGSDGISSVLVPPGDAAALASAVGRLLDDPVLRMRIGHAGRARVLDRFAWRATAHHTIEQYRRVLDRC
ncbi:MAG: glycosyltransferase family 4 protein [Actinomycetota bacterium]